MAGVMARRVKRNTATRLRARADLVDGCEGRACGDASAASTPYARSPEELAAALPQHVVSRGVGDRSVLEHLAGSV